MDSSKRQEAYKDRYIGGWFREWYHTILKSDFLYNNKENKNKKVIVDFHLLLYIDLKMYFCGEKMAQENIILCARSKEGKYPSLDRNISNKVTVLS